MPTFEEKLIKAVVRKRELEGLSIRGLSAAVGISFSTLARIERGDGQPDNNSKIRLLEWLGPDAEEAGLTFDNVAFVHFRAGKNIRSGTVKSLLRAADCLREALADPEAQGKQAEPDEPTVAAGMSLSKEELEQTAEKFRKDLGQADDEALDSLRLQVDGVTVVRVSDTNCLSPAIAQRLRGDAVSEWSAMSVPLDPAHESWAVLLNDGHTVERQRVTVLEEFWHILLGHKLTKIARIAEAYGRTYDKAEEHDAFYLASATLLPKSAVTKAVSQKTPSDQIARMFGTSPELVDYRIKRLGLWRDHLGKEVKLAPK
jgi:transcriptional regulator with XRE-family HTH domain